MAETTRREVWRANLSLRENGLVVGTQGNASGVIRERGEILIKPSGVDYGELAEEMIVRVGLDGKALPGERFAPSVDTPHHAFLYRRLPGIGGICHTHSKHVVVFSILGIGIPVLTTAQADVFGREIPVTPYVDNTGDKIGRCILEAREKTGCPAIILGRHGLFTLAESPAKSAFYALMAEYCAEVALLAFSAGKSTDIPVEPLDCREAARWFKRYNSSRYGQKKAP